MLLAAEAGSRRIRRISRFHQTLLASSRDCRFGNADPKINSDFQPDVRSLSFSSISLTDAGLFLTETSADRISHYKTPGLCPSTTPLHSCDHETATAPNPAVGLWSLSFRDKLRVLRTMTLVQVQCIRNQTVPTTPVWEQRSVRHGPSDVVSIRQLRSRTILHVPWKGIIQQGLQDELIRHLNQDADEWLRFWSPIPRLCRMTYWGSIRTPTSGLKTPVSIGRRGNAFATRSRGLLSCGIPSFRPDAAEMTYFDVTGNSTPDSTPLGSIIVPLCLPRLPAEKQRASHEKQCRKKH